MHLAAQPDHFFWLLWCCQRQPNLHRWWLWSLLQCLRHLWLFERLLHSCDLRPDVRKLQRLDCVHHNAFEHSDVEHGPVEFGAVERSAVEFDTFDFGSMEHHLAELIAFEFSAVEYHFVEFVAIEFGVVDFITADSIVTKFGAIDHPFVEFSAVEFGNIEFGVQQPFRQCVDEQFLKHDQPLRHEQFLKQCDRDVFRLELQQQRPVIINEQHHILATLKLKLRGHHNDFIIIVLVIKNLQHFIQFDISLPHDSFCEIDLPFDMHMYSQSNTTSYASTNGFISIGYGSSQYQADTLPDVHIPNSTVAPFFDDLYLTGTSSPKQGIFYQINAAQNITYEYYLGRMGTSEIFHFTVDYNIATQGVFVFTYYSAGNTTDQGIYASVGTQELSITGGQIGTQYSFQSAQINPGLVVTCDTTANTCVTTKAGSAPV
ncbi:hypothetical protein LTR08_008329 [Meristemomyces frigidus]|nr:hypothetical protein LTR08_008329 [Meristemomyces frigidus]